jgi:uncharacterized protein (TIGR02271 family)
MLTMDQISQLGGGTVYGQGGDKLGSIGQIYVDDQTGQPEWVTVKTGLFGSKESFVPLAQAETQADGLSVPYAKNMVKGAPTMDADGHLSRQDEDDLYRYYGLGDGTSDGTGYAAGTVQDSHAGPTDLTGQAGVVGRDTSGPTTDDAMTRSEEHLVAGTQRVETGRARLRKHVVTETQQVSVPVSHEEVTLEREPITDANRDAAYAGGDITEEEHEVTLMAEKPVVGVETEAIERVRLGTETVTGTETVSGEVRKEQIEMDDPTGTAKKNKRSKR